MLRKKYEFDQEFSILIQLIGEMDDFIFKIDQVLEDEQLTVELSAIIEF